MSRYDPGVERLLSLCGVKLYKTVPQKVAVLTDQSCRMQEVRVNNKLIMMGNYWDFHPGCHGFYDIPDFRGASSLAGIFVDYFRRIGEEVTYIKENYTYAE